jgi:hypothetical protein
MGAFYCLYGYRLPWLTEYVAMGLSAMPIRAGFSQEDDRALKPANNLVRQAANFQLTHTAAAAAIGAHNDQVTKVRFLHNSAGGIVGSHNFWAER